MKKAIHYFNCICRLTGKYTSGFFKLAIFKTKKVIAVAKAYFCIYIMASSSDCGGSPDMQAIYPDTGHLCDVKGFEFKECKYDLSIIVPTHNVSKFIEECIGSIINQTTKYTYELIIVDDGSTDDTPEKIDKYLLNKSIKFIKQTNLGQSAARNRAISISQGRYLMFVDGDDVLLPNSINALMNATKHGSDIVEGNCINFFKEITQEMIDESKTKHIIKAYSKEPRFVLTCFGYSVAKVYKRELWKTLRFPEGYIFEDIITKFILRRKANSVEFIGTPVYGYRRNPNSSSHGNNTLKKLDSIWVFPKIIELCLQEKAPMDEVFYLLALNHIGLLNYIIVKKQEDTIKKACFKEMRRQLISIRQLRPRKMPKMFILLEKSILKGNSSDWEMVADTILKYDMLKKWRERN